jgi:hypothetical protein
MDNLQRLLDFLNKLQDHKIYYRLEHVRPDTLVVLVTVPGERWEIEFLADGDTLSGDAAKGLLEQLFDKHGD